MISFDVPAYQIATGRFFKIVVDGVADLDPVLSQVARSSTIHAGPTRNVSGTSPLEQDMVSVERKFSVPDAVIRESQLNEYGLIILGVAIDYVNDLGGHLIAMLSDVTEASGNAIDAGGAPLSWDLILDQIERVEIEFDADGNPRLPSLMGNPNTLELLSAIPRTPEHDLRFASILEKKRQDYDAQKRRRQLSC